ncbi:MAG: hypothetical protein ACPL0A_03700, partial [Candidatus Micrarchaeia archaeon]
MPSEIKIQINRLEPITTYKHKLEISKKFGADGLRLFGLLEKSTDIEYLKANSKVNEDTLYRILGFMGKLGLITVEGLPEKYVKEIEIEEETIIGIVATDSLTRFRHQKDIFKVFSSDGIKVYEYIRGKEASIENISNETGIAKEKVREIVEFMLTNNICYTKRMPAKEKKVEIAPIERPAPPKEKKVEISPIERPAPPEEKKVEITP